MADGLSMPFGDPFPYWAGSLGFNAFTLNATTDQWEVIFQADRAMTITRAGYRYDIRTGTPPTYKMSLQGVTDGIPNGTIKGGASPVSVTFTPPADTTWNAGYRWHNFDNSYVCTDGELLALVIAYSAGTVNASNNSSFTNWMTTAAQQFRRPYPIQNDAGVRTRQVNIPIFGYGTTTKAYGRPIETLNSHSFSSGSSPNEYAMKFTVPAGWWSTAKMRQFMANMALPTATTQTWNLYDGGGAADTTVLQAVTLDSDYWQSNLGQGHSLNFFDDSVLSSLTAGNTYRLSIAPATGSVTIFSMDVDAVADWDAWPGGQNVCLSTRAGGNWTDTTTRRLHGWNVLFDEITAPSGGSGTVLIGGGIGHTGIGVH